MIEKGEVH